MNPIHYFNGQFVEKDQIHISVDNVGFLRGYGVFEFFKVHGNKPLFMDDHLERLFRSAGGINLEVPLSREEIKEVVTQLIGKNQMPYSSIKIIVSGGNSSDGFTPGKPEMIVLNAPFTDQPASVYEQGASLMMYQYHRDFPHIKSLYYVTTVALQAEWKGKGHVDVLYHDGQQISEVSRSNVFLFKDGKLKTNEAGVLAGITRMHVLKAAESHFHISIGPITLEEIFSADEVFITSTSKKVMPIVKLDERQIGDGKPGMYTHQMIEIFDRYIEEEL